MQKHKVKSGSANYNNIGQNIFPNVDICLQENHNQIENYDICINIQILLTSKLLLDNRL